MKKKLYVCKENCIYNKENGKMYKVNTNTKELIERYIGLNSTKDFGKDEIEVIEKFRDIIDSSSKNNKIENDISNIETVSVQLIVCNACNMSCKYCYAHDGTYNREKSMMNFETAKCSIDYMLKKYKKIDVLTFFGGEPLLCIELIDKVCEYIYDKYKDRCDKLAIMSNLYNVSNRAIEVIKKYDIQVGTSLDGNKKLNAYRVDSEGKETYSKVVNNINLMYKSVKQPVVAEVTMSNLHSDNGYDESDIVNLLKEIIHVKNYTVNKVQNFENKMNSCDYKKEKSNIAVKVDKFINTGTYDMDINDLIALMNGKGYMNSFCVAGVKKFTVLPDGEIYPCQLYCLDKTKKFLMGNVKDSADSTFEEKVKKIERFSNKNTYEKCESCYAKSVCRSCLGLKVSLNEELPHNKKECEEIRSYFTELVEIYAHLIMNKDKYNKFKERVKEVNGIICEGC